MRNEQINAAYCYKGLKQLQGGGKSLYGGGVLYVQ